MFAKTKMDFGNKQTIFNTSFSGENDRFARQILLTTKYRTVEAVLCYKLDSGHVILISAGVQIPVDDPT